MTHGTKPIELGDCNSDGSNSTPQCLPLPFSALFDATIRLWLRRITKRHVQVTDPVEDIVQQARLLGRNFDGPQVDEYLEVAVALLTEGLEICSSDHARRPLLLALLCDTHRRQYDRHADPEQINSALSFGRRAVEITPPDYANRPFILNCVASALIIRYEHHGEKMDLMDAIAFCREGVMLCSSNNPWRSNLLNHLGYALKLQHNADGSLETLAEAIECHQESLKLLAPNDSQRGAVLNNLGIALVSRYYKTANINDLKQAIACYREDLQLTRVSGCTHSSSTLANLGVGLTELYGTEGRSEDLEEAIAHLRVAVDLSGPTNGMALSALAAALTRRFEKDGLKQDIEEAIQLHRKRVAACAPNSPGRVPALINLGTALQTRRRLEGNAQDLKDAIECYQEALRLCTPAHTSRSAALNNLGLALQLHFDVEGNMDDLTQSILYLRENVELSPPGSESLFLALNSLASALKLRHRSEGNREDLEEVINLNRQALETCLPSNPLRPLTLDALGVALRNRYHDTKQLADLEDAIRFQKEADRTCPPGREGRVSILNNIGISLKQRYNVQGRVEDLTEAISYYQEMLALCSPDSPNRPVALNNLANGLQERYEHNKQPSDVLQAVAYLREGLSLCPAKSPIRSSVVSALAHALWKQFILFSTGEIPSGPEFDEVILLHDETANNISSPIADRLSACTHWLRFATMVSDVPVVLRAFRTLLDLLDIATTRAHSLDDQYIKMVVDENLRKSQALVSEYALYCIAQRHVEVAVELLERGRAMLLTQFGRYRMPLDELQAIEPALADRFTEISRELETALASGMDRPGVNDVTIQNKFEDRGSRHHRLTTEWNKLVAEIRSLENFHDFLKPTSFSKLQQAAEGGPVVLVVVGEDGSQAVIVRADGPPHDVALPLATRATLDDLLDQLKRHCKVSHNSGVMGVLRKMWMWVVEPIVQHLEILGVPRKSRIWWYPTSIAAKLPLHAAGPYRKGEDNVNDLYISSYTPTLGALIRARRQAPAPSQESRLLLIGQPDTPGQPMLPSVSAEVDKIKALVPNATTLEGSAGTREAVLRELKQHSWVHLACHGHLNFDQPFKSNFALYDGGLALLDIIKNDLPDAQFAMLSACHSAASDGSVPDEALTLSGGMQFAGFRSVVGTLWAMNDEDGPVLAKEFYKKMVRGNGGFKEGTNAAVALHNAIKVLRVNRVPTSRWINFVHIGA
ncbi:hypothetical protein FRB99_004821 [Tulasnella sp. 403]|nr:hypothetical protein FRB99_004821 [Tulasnella sp. 403]